MKNLRTHMWICFTLGVFLLLALSLTYFAMSGENLSTNYLEMIPALLRVWGISLGIYLVYFLTVLFMAIKYVPSKV